MAVVVVTGCSSGFGFEGALAFARNGDEVYATMRDTAKAGPLKAAAEKDALSFHIRQLDVTRPETFDAFFNEVVMEAGRVDVLVNNAGILRPGAFEDLTEQAIREVMETNFFGPLLLTRAVLPQLRKQRAGYIIMVSSLSGIAGLAGDVAYTASKFALEGATEALRHEVDRWGIKLALIQAAMYATGIFKPDLSKDTCLPADYPPDSPYRILIDPRLRALAQRMPDALDPRIIGELFVKIANSDGSRLRWPADVVAEKVLGAMFAQDDAARDAFLRQAAEIDWWSQGKVAP